MSKSVFGFVKEHALKFYVKFRTNSFKIITNPYLISTVIAVAIILTLPPIFNKYKIEILQVNTITPDLTYYYADLNNDGVSEEIELRQIQNDFFSLTVFENNKVIEQWNFDGEFIRTFDPIVTRIGSDSLGVIYFLSFKNYKIYLNCLNPYENKIVTKNKFVVDYKPIVKDLDLTINPGIFIDQNKDGIKEFYFSISVGYSKQPRRVFKYDPAQDTVYVSSMTSAAIPDKMIVDTSDNELRLILASSAFGNSNNYKPYSDMNAWLFCYNENLDLKYKPIQIGVYPSLSKLISFSPNNKRTFVCMNIYEGAKKHLCTLRSFDSNLRLVKEEQFQYSPEWKVANLYSNYNEPNFFYIIKGDGSVEKLDPNFNVVKEFHIPPVYTTTPYFKDIDGDNRDELIFLGKDLDEIIIARDDFSNYSTIDYKGSKIFWHCSLKLNGKQNRELRMFSNDKELAVSYGLNYLYYLKYPIYAGVYLAVLLLILLIQKAQKHRAELRYETEKQIAELQLKAIKNQIDPHFTLNIINSIGSLFYKKDKEKADYVFGKYSRLLRSTVLNSDKIITTLADELDYIENYLELENFRHNNKFYWKFDVAENVNTSIKIPKMLLHTFVENAIKHGLRHLEKDGELFVSINCNQKEYFITIRDNGIGRKRAKDVEIENTGKGLHILEQILRLYYDLTKIKISYQITDLVDGKENSLGTEVLIKIPIS
ncbi:MAG: histidine kinase [Bacteroidetes bacterium]|nr:histidine kinase [Bacteroidota bacterium]